GEYDQLVKNEALKRSKLKNGLRAVSEKPSKPDLGLYIPPHRKPVDIKINDNEHTNLEIEFAKSFEKIDDKTFIVEHTLNKSPQTQIYAEQDMGSKSSKKTKPGMQLYIPPHRKIPQ
uniref:Uncharacterized protein n=1 Tax=Romanomermis culicivorax TaxID=13658 RepID=A0A915HTL9_ROMCU